MTRCFALAFVALLLVTPQMASAYEPGASAFAPVMRACAESKAMPLAAKRFAFPRDDGAHEGFASEWWRTFGRVSDARGERYDFSVNVSRFDLGACASPAAGSAGASGRWSSHAIVTTTFELVDESGLVVERGTRVEREGAFGARIGPRGLDLTTTIARYAATRARARTDASREFDLSFADRSDGLSLVQTIPRSAVPLGPNGIMRAGTCRGCEAYAYAYPRTATRGTLRIAGVDHRVSGTTWIEHEFAHRELGANDAGWNRYELQFDDGRELDARFTRDRAGKVVALSGMFVSATGAVTYLHDDDARVTNVLHTVWRSAPSGITYPSLWSLDVGFAHLGLATVEIALDQEARDMQRTPYYSGAVVVERVGPPEGDRGHGFVELTGYGAPVSL